MLAKKRNLGCGHNRKAGSGTRAKAVILFRGRQVSWCRGYAGRDDRDDHEAASRNHHFTAASEDHQVTASLEVRVVRIRQLDHADIPLQRTNRGANGARFVKLSHSFRSYNNWWYYEKHTQSLPSVLLVDEG